MQGPQFVQPDIFWPSNLLRMQALSTQMASIGKLKQEYEDKV